MPGGYLVFQFSTSHDWQSGLIRDVCRSPFSHVDACASDGSLFGASDSPKAPVVRGNPSGVAFRTPAYQQFLRRRRAIVSITPSQYDLFWELAEKELGKAFDHDAVSFKYWFSDQPFLREWRYDESWFCAELHAYLCERISLWEYPLVVPKNGVAPHNFLEWIWPKMVNRSSFWLFPRDLVPMEGEEVDMRNLDASKVALMFAGAV